MGKGKVKPYVIISGFNTHDSNRGTAALGYGSITFLKEHGWLHSGQTLVNFRIVKSPIKKQNLFAHREEITIDGETWKHVTYNVFEPEWKLFLKTGTLLPFTTFGRMVRKVELVAAINGGDGFSDIYSTATFYSRLFDTEVAMRQNIPLIQLPQTLGPFSDKANYNLAKKILKYSTKVFIRDDKFVDELQKMGVQYEQTKDLSYYMKPQPWDLDIQPGAVGINVSGLTYYNNFRTLANQFGCYHELVKQLVTRFQQMGKPVYLIPHTYIYNPPLPDQDDMLACREVYQSLVDKTGVAVVDKDLISPQVKYVISRMSFFIGTRMHANFAAIYTHVPLYGLAYSYKFEGAFNANGIYNRTTMINNITVEDIPDIINKVVEAYHSDVKP